MPGAQGSAVRELQRRLTIAGHLEVGVAEVGTYCPLTELAVISFQSARGLRPHGRCDDATWATLLEASWRLGDRVLGHTSPHLRGDDVSELQSLLARLGFDCGRVDGILGPRTTAAIEDFQRNCGLPIDGLCRHDTVTALRRLSRHSGQGPGVSMVRESEVIRTPQTSLAEHRVVIGHFGGLAPIVRIAQRMIRATGAQSIALDDSDSADQARIANHFDAEVYVGLEARACPGVEVAFYSAPSYTSPAGRALAHLVLRHIQPLADPAADHHVVGLRLPILRETRMPAVLITLGPVRTMVEQAAETAAAITTALSQWICLPQLEES